MPLQTLMLLLRRCSQLSLLVQSCMSTAIASQWNFRYQKPISSITMIRPCWSVSTLLLSYMHVLSTWHSLAATSITFCLVLIIFSSIRPRLPPKVIYTLGVIITIIQDPVTTAWIQRLYDVLFNIKCLYLGKINTMKMWITELDIFHA